MLYHLKLKPLLLASDWLTRFSEVTLVRQKKRPGQELWLRPEASSGLKSFGAGARTAQPSALCQRTVGQNGAQPSHKTDRVRCLQVTSASPFGANIGMEQAHSNTSSARASTAGGTTKLSIPVFLRAK
jgi:hypothetical protein